MKKVIIAAAFAVSSGVASADTLIGGDIELNMWQQSFEENGSSISDDENALTFEASLEHFIPLIPNIKVGRSSVDNDNHKYTKTDATLYYEFLDNDLVALDLGAGMSFFTDGEIANQSFEAPVPHAYAMTKVGVPFTPFSVYAKGYGIMYNDSQLLDLTMGAQYTLSIFYAFDIDLQGGYRMQQINLDKFDDLTVDFDTKTDGFFMGVNLDF